MYDRVGQLVEEGIRGRNSGTLAALPEGSTLTKSELEAAAARLPTVPSKRQRETVLEQRRAAPDGVGLHALTQFPVGLETRGDPRIWPYNVINGGRLLVDGGRWLDTKTMAAEAQACLAEFED
ncbi:unnamed protein product [Discosporangium mesarthrocarpum]